MLAHWSIGQSIGVRADLEVSDSRKSNKAIGFGAYVNFNNFSDKFEIMLHSDYTRKNETLRNVEGGYIDYSRVAAGVAGLYRMPLTNKIAFKLGPDISYNWTQAFREGNGWTVEDGYRANYAGIGIATNLHFQEVLELPVNLDLFVTPDYLIRTKHTPYNNTHAEKTSKRLNIQIGVSYLLRKD